MMEFEKKTLRIGHIYHDKFDIIIRIDSKDYKANAELFEDLRAAIVNTELEFQERKSNERCRKH